MKKETNANPIVLVTGGSRGIGRATCLAFAKAGYDVAVNYAGNQAAAEDTAQACRELNPEGKVAVYAANVADADAVDAMFKAVKADFGALDVLVNNAGITRDGLFMRMKDGDWNDVLQCDLSAHARLTQLAISKMMRRRSGRIISIASIVGETGNAGQANYAAAKAGLIGFSKALAKEAAARGITVNCVAPGFVATDMTAALKPEQLKAWTDTIPLKRAATASDIAGAVVFLASDLASYITGTVIDVNGGLYCG